jgi:hypothetical protein
VALFQARCFSLACQPDPNDTSSAIPLLPSLVVPPSSSASREGSQREPALPSSDLLQSVCFQEWQFGENKHESGITQLFVTIRKYLRQATNEERRCV